MLKVDGLRFCGFHCPSILMLNDFHFSRELLILVSISFNLKKKPLVSIQRICFDKSFGLVLDSLQKK
jgi:hypothetical protein